MLNESPKRSRSGGLNGKGRRERIIIMDSLLYIYLINKTKRTKVKKVSGEKVNT